MLLAVSILSTSSVTAFANENNDTSQCEIAFKEAAVSLDMAGQYFKELFGADSECRKGLRIVKETQEAQETQKAKEMLAVMVGVYQGDGYTIDIDAGGLRLEMSVPESFAVTTKFQPLHLRPLSDEEIKFTAAYRNFNFRIIGALEGQTNISPKSPVSPPSPTKAA